jgi:hypothetical protein
VVAAGPLPRPKPRPRPRCHFDSVWAARMRSWKASFAAAASAAVADAPAAPAPSSVRLRRWLGTVGANLVCRGWGKQTKGRGGKESRGTWYSVRGTPIAEVKKFVCCWDGRRRAAAAAGVPRVAMQTSMWLLPARWLAGCKDGPRAAASRSSSAVCRCCARKAFAGKSAVFVQPTLTLRWPPRPGPEEPRPAGGLPSSAMLCRRRQQLSCCCCLRRVLLQVAARLT